MKDASWKSIAGLSAFLRDKIYVILFTLGTAILLLLLLLALKAEPEVIIVVIGLLIACNAASLMIDYYRRRHFYQNLLQNLQTLDRAYLILETLEAPNFYDGKILWEALYAVNKSMADNVKQYANKTQDFREYIELWIHEVNTPLAALILMNHDPKIAEQLHRLDSYLEQVLYYARAEYAESDYLIKKLKLSDIVHSLAMHYREILQTKNIDFRTENLNLEVYSDAKWLEFILGQILMNSIKYGSSSIVIAAEQNAHGDITLEISDNGIGISKQDLPRIFEGSFTGKNGHQADSSHSTGMGLYIVKTLCDKLGHQIAAESILGQGTTLKITFNDHDYYHVTET